MRPDPSQMSNEEYEAWVAEEIEKARPAYENRPIYVTPEIDWSEKWNKCSDASGVIEGSRHLKAMHSDLPPIDKVMQGIEEIKINGKLAFISLYLDDMWAVNEHWMSIVFIDGEDSYLLKWIVDGRARFGSRLYLESRDELIEFAQRKIAELESIDAPKTH